jgi:hypothetical protein
MAKDIKRLCEWFARCNNEATTTVDHPILGAVPACERCAYFAEHGEFPKEKTA